MKRPIGLYRFFGDSVEQTYWLQLTEELMIFSHYDTKRGWYSARTDPVGPDEDLVELF